MSNLIDLLRLLFNLWARKHMQCILRMYDETEGQGREVAKKQKQSEQRTEC